MMYENPLIECPRCGHQFRVTETREWDMGNTTYCVACGYHGVGSNFLVIKK